MRKRHSKSSPREISKGRTNLKEVTRPYFLPQSHFLSHLLKKPRVFPSLSLIKKSRGKKFNVESQRLRLIWKNELIKN